MATVVDSIRELHNVIVNCIKDPALLSQLLASDVISPDDGSRIRDKYLHGDNAGATELMLECFYRSTHPGKEKAFLEALQRTEFPYLKNLIEKKEHEDLRDAHPKKIIQIFAPYLEQRLDCDAIITQLVADEVLKEPDREIIATTQQNKGKTYAVIVLLDRMQHRVSPGKWYYRFLNVLVSKGYKDVVEKIEPDFLDNPSAFRQLAVNSFNTDTIQPSTSFSSNTRAIQHDQSADEGGMPGSPREHLMEDFVTSEERMDDEGTPNQTCSFEAQDTVYRDKETNNQETKPSQYDVTTSSDSEDISNEKALNNLNARLPPDGQELEEREEADINLKAFNIKPDVTKNLQISGIEEKGDEKQPSTDKEDSDGDDSDGGYEEHVSGGNYQLRSYQLELAENALAGKNTIICAPTGCGKTWVALHIIDEHLRQAQNGKRRVVFMARNGALVKQQVDRITQCLPKRTVKHLIGATEEAQMMHVYMDDFDIFCFTPQILVNNLNKEIKSLAEFSLMIFDECHHTKGGEPYLMLMRRYLVEKSKGVKSLPQIVGLTATPGSGNAMTENDALEHIIKLCACLDVRCLSTVEKNMEDLQKKYSIPTEETIPMQTRSYDPCKGIILDAMGKVEDILLDKVIFEKAMIEILHDKPKNRESKLYKKWTADVIKTAETLANTNGRDTRACARYLQTYNDALEVNKLLATKNVASYLNQKMSQEIENSDRHNDVETQLFQNLKGVQKELIKVKEENPNILILSQALKSHFSKEDEESRAMVFVEARATCRALVDFLNKELETTELKVTLLIGKGDRDGDKGMTEEQQTKIVEDFRNGVYKVLVVTSIGIEGIDVPDCNMILDYNYHGNEITKIQMKGRSRKGGKNIMIASADLMERNKITMYRIHLMKRGIEQFKRLHTNVLNRKVLAFQRKEQDQYESWIRTNEFKRQKQTDETDYQVQCIHCQRDLFNASDIRQVDKSNIHLVALRDFGDKIKKTPNVKRPRMGVLTKKFKMFCNGCTNDLGVVATKGNLWMEFYALKIEGLRFVSCKNPKDISTYKSWPMPYKVREIQSYELDRIYEADEENKAN